MHLLSRYTVWLCMLAAASPVPWLAEAKAKTVINRDAADAIIRKLAQQLGPEAAIQPVYVGSEACMGCHQDKQDYRSSLHATGLKMARTDTLSMKIKDGVIADFDRNGVDDFKQGLDFNKVSGPFNQFRPNAPILGYKAGTGYTVTIAGMEYLVGFLHGGSGLYKQRFVLRFPVTDRASGWSADYYYSPVQYNETSQTYVGYSTNYWYNADNTPKITTRLSAKEAAATGKSFNKDCVGCHSTVFSIRQEPSGEWVSETATPVYARPDDPHYLDLDDNGWPEAYNIGCERCHGPGSTHIMNLGDPKRIINPVRDFTALQQNELCGACHSRGTSMDGKHEYPLSLAGVDMAKELGGDLYGKYWIDKPGLWPDNKTSRQHHQQMQELKKSSKWEFAPHKVTCSECHDPHNAQPQHLRTKLKVSGAAGATLEIAVKAENNTLCLACHAGFGPFSSLTREMITKPQDHAGDIHNATVIHTRHSYNPEGSLGLSRCTGCHMAKMAASGDPYDMSSHTFEVVPPSKTLQYQARGGMPNSCAVRCHRPLAPVFGLPADSSLTNWTESSDKLLAEWLGQYYGPNGIWWKTASQ